MIEALADGVVSSGPLVLVLAVAYAFLYGYLGIMDLTLAVRGTLAAYVAWSVAAPLEGVDPRYSGGMWGAALAAGAAAALVTWGLLARLQRSTSLTLLVGSLGVAIVFEALLQEWFGVRPEVFGYVPSETNVSIGVTTASPTRVVGLAYAALVVVLAFVLVRSTELGSYLEIVASDPEGARVTYGLRPRLLSVVTYVVIGIVVVPAAVIHGMALDLKPQSGAQAGLLAFVAAIMAGRRQPLTAVWVAIGLLMLGGAADRWRFGDMLVGLVAMAIAVAAFVLARQHLAGVAGRWGIPAERMDQVRLVAACVAGVLVLVTLDRLVGSEWRESGWLSWRLPGDFRHFVQYVAVVVALLLVPDGLSGRRMERVV